MEKRFLYYPVAPADSWEEPPPGLAVEDVQLTSADGTRQVDDYYAFAPCIVDAIDARADAAAIYRSIYRDGIVPAVAAIKRGQHSPAHAHLARLIGDLRERFGEGKGG